MQTSTSAFASGAGHASARFRPMPEPLTRAWLVTPHRAERHCGYIYARKRRRARRLALATDPYRGPRWYLLVVRRVPQLDGLADWGTTIWEAADIPPGLDPALLLFSIAELAHLPRRSTAPPFRPAMPPAAESQQHDRLRPW